MVAAPRAIKALQDGFGFDREEIPRVAAGTGDFAAGDAQYRLLGVSSNVRGVREPHVDVSVPRLGKAVVEGEDEVLGQFRIGGRGRADFLDLLVVESEPTHVAAIHTQTTLLRGNGR